MADSTSTEHLITVGAECGHFLERIELRFPADIMEMTDEIPRWGLCWLCQRWQTGVQAPFRTDYDVNPYRPEDDL